MKVIERKLKETMLKDLKAGKVFVLFGARRVGKTFFLNQLLAASNQPFLWLNGEDMEIQKQLEIRSTSNYQRLIANNEILIVDEAQVIPEIGLILKLMVDTFPNLIIIASGSSAFDLSNNLGEPLVGRAYWYTMFPLAQLELKKHENHLETVQNLEERLIFGSYPELINLETIDKKERYLRDLVNTYLLKDIINFEGIRNSNKIFDLLKLIAFQVGKEVSILEIGTQLGMSKNTVEKYLDLLEKVFILKKIKGYSKNLRKEVSKSSRWYFWDNGIRNAIIGNFKSINLRNDIGELWENYIISERLKKNTYDLSYVESYFWRTYDQQEIDYLESTFDSLNAFEIKWTTRNIKIPEAFRKTYPEASFEIITSDNYLEFIC
jgi:uncharacterized protein